MAARFIIAVVVIVSGACAFCEDTQPLFRFVHITDSHCTFPEDMEKTKDFGGRIYSRSFEIFEGALKYVEDEVKPAFVVHTGDILENGGWGSGLRAMQKVKEMTDGRSFRFFPVFGNHDVVAEKFERVFGPCNYMFACGNTLFVILSTWNEYTPFYQRSSDIPMGILYQLDDLLMDWNGNVVLAVHHPLRCHQDEEGWARVVNHEQVIALLERHGGVALVLQGHTHIFMQQTVENIAYVTGPGLVNIWPQADGKLGHGMLVYDVYPDRMEVVLHGAASTDDAINGVFCVSEDLQFTIPLPRNASVPANYQEGLWKRSLPAAVHRYDVELERGTKPVVKYLFNGWRFDIDRENKGMELGWHKGDADDSEWRQLTRTHLRHLRLAPEGYEGFVWYRMTLTIPEELRGNKLQLVLGSINDCDETYLNGTSIGKTGAFPPDEIDPKTRTISRVYTMPAELLNYGGENVISVRVYYVTDRGGIRGMPHVRIAR